MRISSRRVRVSVLAALFLAVLSGLAEGVPIPVTSTADSGLGTLRQAILDAELTAGSDTITFNVNPLNLPITLLTPLPTITKPIIIDGTTQPLYAGVPIIEINGNGITGNGLRISAGTSQVKALVIRNFDGNGILLQTNGSNTVTNCYIGTNAAGSAASANTGHGVQISSPSGTNTIGGDATKRNLISGNTGEGVFISSGATNNTVQGNFIGTDVNGTAAIPNGGAGIRTLGATTTIGGSFGTVGNLISGNVSRGIYMDPSAAGSIVQGNLIGTNAAGNAALGNQSEGFANFASGVQIGGILGTGRNVISGNSGNGVTVSGATLMGGTIVNNYIGTNAAGTAAIPNSGNGVGIFSASSVTIGGTFAGARNVLSGNGGSGVSISGTGGGNLVEGNYIGLNATGTAAIPNAGGVSINGALNTKIGDAAAGAGNVISGNTFTAIAIGSNAAGTLVQGNLIGTNAAGDAAVGNGSDAVRMVAASTTTIGGTTAAARNVISGNGGNGIANDSGVTGTTVQGNYIGLNAAGTAALANAGGATIGGTGNLVGGTAAGAGNVISGNTTTGLSLTGSTNTVQGNFVGTNPAGTAAIGNGGIGIRVNSGTGNTIGGAGGRNIVSGNSNSGIVVDGTASATTIQGNYVGTNATGTAAIANGGGITVGNTNNLVGGTVAGAGNLISGNTANGVAILGSTNTLQGNFIGTNAAGSAAIGNVGSAVRVVSGTGNLIGGTAAGAKNVISGNGGNGIEIDGTASSVTIQGNSIGTNPAGTAAIPNAGGITISGNANTIGGTAAGAGNLISANTFNNIALFGPPASGNVIQGNIIGTNAAGTAALGSTGIGIRVLTSNGNTIGGTTAAARNLVSGNFRGITLEFGSTGNVIQGNYIGTNQAGTGAVPNTEEGIAVGAPNNTIGGTAAGAGNVISGQTTGYGVWIQSAAATGTKVYGNIIGMRPDGVTPLPNVFGVLISGGFSAEIGGTAAGQPNIIGGNSFEGVRVQNGYTNAILGNSIFSNTTLGIDIEPGGVATNDPQDPDSGANKQQNYPLLSSVSVGGGNTTIVGTLNSNPNTSLRVEFFGNPACSPTGMGEGKTFLGFATVVTDGGGNAAINSILPVPAPGAFVTGTATGPASGTSEFSPCAAVGGPNPGVIQVAATTLITTEVDGFAPVIVTRSSGMQGTVTVNYTTNDGSATQPADYTLTSGTLTFLDGEVIKTINVPLINDGAPEPQQVFTLTISSPGGGAVLGSQVMTTIVLDDVSAAFPAVSISDVTLTEGNAGTTIASFTVNVSAHSSTITVGWNTSDGTAVSPSDYTGASGSLVFMAGQFSKTVDIAIVGETVPEPDEDFFVTINSILPNGFVTKAIGEGIITNDDGDPPFPAEAKGLLVDVAPNGGLSDGNGIFEPGETAIVKPSWKNLGAVPLALSGAVSGFTGLPGATYSVNDAASDYGNIPISATNNCAVTGNCLTLTVSDPVSRPATHWDATFTEVPSDGQPAKDWSLHLGESFTDVPKNHVFYQFVERILHKGVTVGCTGTTYCPDDTVFRLQMAVFIARAQAGGDSTSLIPVSGSAQGNPYNCIGGGISQFTDVDPTNPFCRHVHYIFSTGVTTGCITTPPRQYCPGDNVSRGQMALFIGRAVAGSDAAVPQTYGPDPVTGRSYSCNVGTPNLHFTDIATGDIYCRHTHYLWAKDVISGFPDGSFGPGLDVTRGAMAKFLANGFNLQLYGP